MAVFLPALGVAARMAATRVLPRVAARVAPRVASRFPQLGANATRFVGNPARATQAFMQKPLFGRFATNSTTGLPRKGGAFNPLNFSRGTAMLTPEWMLYESFANSQTGQNLQDKIRSWGQKNAPATTGAIERAEDQLFDWGIFGEDSDRRPGAGGGTTPDSPAGPGGSGLGSADYSAYEEKLRNAGNAASVNLAGLQQQYDQVINELKSQYQLAETEEEKERIRYIVADVEAQREAGEKAIGEIYATKIQEIQKTAAMSREETTRSAQAAGNVWRQGAQDLRQGAQGSRDELVAQNRGLGIGAPSASGADPFVNLMSGMAPVSQNYAQRIGDIGAQAIDFIGATAQGQQGAQQADLQRLALATSSAARTQHASEVAQRIATERLAMNQQIAALRSQQMGDISSARELNAQLANAAADRRAEQAGDLPPRMQALVEARSWGRENPELTYQDYAEWHERQFGVPPGPDAFAAYELGVTERE